MKRQFFALICVIALTAAALSAATATNDGEPRSTQSGVYSAEQAERGSKLFEEACIACHEPDEFAQPSYMESWSGSSADDFVQLVRATMPQDNPGRLKREEYIDIVSYFFQASGLPAGEEEMDATTISEIRIEGPFGGE